MKHGMRSESYFNRLFARILIAVLLVISILSVYYQVKDFEFIYYDDPKYVRDNPMVGQGITIESIRWAFSSIGYASNWHPLTWISHMVDVELFGLNPGMHHLINVFFHIANTLLLFFVFFRITREMWRCAAVAALFALHPLHVESIAWIAERKDVLSTFFMMLTVWGYFWYVERRVMARYFLVMVLYALGLMAKPMLVTLPFVLLLLDLWPIKRPELVRSDRDILSDGRGTILTDIDWKGFIGLIWEKIPLFVFSGISIWITYLAQDRGGAVSSLDILPLTSRMANAAIASITYLLKIFLPFDLAIFYPYPGTFNPLMVAGSLFFLSSLTLIVLMISRQFPFLFVGWLWYLGTLSPVLGIVQVGFQSMADRYTYIPFIGIFIMLVWGVTSVIERWQTGKPVLISIFLLIIGGLMWTTWIQAGYWKDSKKVFSHALDVTQDNYLAHTNLAAALFEEGDIEGAIHHSAEALKIKPDYVPARCNLGLGLMRQDRYQDAIVHFRQALDIKPAYINAHYNLGASLYELGNVDGSIAEFHKVLQLEPQHAGAIKMIKLAGIKKQKIDRTISQIKEKLQIEPDNYIFHYNVSELYRINGETEKAIDHYERALLIKPDFVQALHNLAILYAANSEFEKALSSLQRIRSLHPNDPDVYYNIACIYSRQGKVGKALEHLSDAINKGFDKQDVLMTDPDLANIRETDFYKNLMVGSNH